MVLSQAQLRSPLFVDLRLTLRCTRATECASRWCGATADASQSGELQLTDLKAMVDKIRDADIFRINLTGGEPTLHPSFLDIASYIRMQKLALTVTTNGMHIDNRAGNLLQEIPDVVYVRLCQVEPLPDSSPEAIQKAFAPSLKGLKTLISFHLPALAAVVEVNEQTHGQILPIAKLLNTMGCRRLSLSRPQQLATADAAQWMITALHQLRDAVEQKLVHGSLAGPPIPFCLLPDAKSMLDKVSWQGCGCGAYGFAVTETGEARFCSFLPEPVGNLLRDSVDTIWKGQPFRCLSPVNLLPDMCRTCAYDVFCLGGCRGMAKSATGDLHAPDPLVNEAIARTLQRTAASDRDSGSTEGVTR